MAYDPYAALGVERPAASAAPVASAKVGYDPYTALGVPKEEVGGLKVAAKQVVGSTIKGVGQLGADFIPGVGADNALVQKGQEIIDANPTAIQGFGDIADKPGTFVKEAVGNALPSVGGMIGLRALGAGITAAAPLAGPAAPLVAGAGQLVSWAGPTVMAALPSYSGIRDAQEDDSTTSKLLALGGAAAVGRIEQMAGGEALAGKLISQEGRNQLTKATGKMALVKTIGKEAGKAAIGEGVEEGLQNPIEQLAGYQNPLTPANLEETALGMTMGAVGGGVLGGAMGPFVHTAAKDAPPPDPTVEEVQKQALAKATGGEVEINNGLATITRGENTLTAPVEALTQHFVAGKTLDDFDTAAATAPKLEELRTALQNDDNPLSFNDLVALRDDAEALRQVGVNRKDIDALIEAEIERGVLPDAAWIKQERLAQQTNQAAFERLQGLDARVQAAQANDQLNQTMDEQVSDYWTRLLQVPTSTAPAGTSPAVGPPPSPTDTSPAGAVVLEQEASAPVMAAVSRLTELEQKAQGLPGVSTPTSLSPQEEQEYIALRAQASPADAQRLQQYQANVARRDALMLKQQGSPAFETVGEGGQATVVPAATPQTLTPAEQTELAQLTAATQQPPVSPYTDDSRTLAAGLPASQSDTLFSQGAQQGEPLNAPALTSTIDKEFGKGTVSRLTRQGKVQIVASAAEVPGVGPLSADQQRKAQGVYRSKEGKIYLVANNLSRGNVLGVFKHEVVHALLRQDATFMARREALLKDFEKLMGKDASVDAAAAKVPAGTPEAVRTEEILAYWTQNEANHKHSLFKRIVASVKAALKRLGIPTTSMTTADFSLLFARGTQDFVGSAPQTSGVTGTIKALYSQAAELFGPKWRSRLAEAVQSKGSTQSASNWLKTLETWEKKGTLPTPVQEELEWSGLKEYLQGLGDQKIARTDIVRYLSENGVQVQEVVKGAYNWTERDALRFNLLTQNESSLTDVERAELAQLRKNLEQSGTKFSSYQLPGGQNYKELLLTLPRKNIPSGTDEFGVPNSARANVNQNYQSTHFDEPNILAHVRFNERVDAQGNKVLFIEEVQSDWHQEGRKKGYKENLTPEKTAKLEQQHHDLTMAALPMPANSNEYAQNYAERSRIQNILDGSNETPDAPFKTSWSMLAMKRMIRYAAENGFDKIAWTTGEQQAERYDLSKQVDYISAGKTGDTYHIIAVKKRRPDSRSGDNLINERGLSIQQIENYVGKDLAEKIAGQEDGAAYTNYEGLDLKVGGEGMKAFYDKMLPTSVGKFIKQFGGKVEVVPFDNMPNKKRRQDLIRQRRELEINSPEWQRLSEEIDQLSLLETGKAKSAVAAEQPGFAITPSMRESALGEGMPLFSTAAQVNEFRLANNLPEIKMRQDKSHPTQITGTRATYRKIYDRLIPDEHKDKRILDYGAGKNIGGKELGAETFEPHPERGFTPTFNSSESIPSEAFHSVISNAVLNVVPDDIRDSIVREVGRVMAPGGRAYINVRGDDVFNAAHTVIDKANKEVIITGNRAYQKGFTQQELIDYLQDTLGPEYSVEKGPSDIGSVFAVVSKDSVEDQILFSTASTAHAAARSRTTFALKEIANDKITEFSPFFLRVAPLWHLVQTVGTKVKQVGRVSKAFDTLNYIHTSEVEASLDNHKENRKANLAATGSMDAFNKAVTTTSFYRMTPWANLDEQEWIPSNAKDASRADKLKAAEMAWKAAEMDTSTGKTFIAAWDESRKTYQALKSNEAKESYKKMALHLTDIRKREENAALAAIERGTIANPTLRAAMMARFDATFKTIKGVYWPLMRWGQYTLEFKNLDGTVERKQFETRKERRLFAKDLVASGIGKASMKTGYLGKTPKGQVAIPNELMTQFSQAIIAERTKGLDPEKDAAEFKAAADSAQETIEDLNDIFLRWQPETAALKNSMRRRNFKGYDLDASRSYLDYVQKHAHRIAWMEQGRVIENELKGLNEEIRDERKKGENTDLKAMVLQDLRERVQAARDVHVGPIASFLGRFGTAYYMTSPSIALVQMTQLPLLTLPKLGVMYKNGTKAAAVLTKNIYEAFAWETNQETGKKQMKYGRTKMFSDPKVNALFDAARQVYTSENRDPSIDQGKALGSKMYSKEDIAQGFAALSAEQKKLFILRESLARNWLDISATHEAEAFIQSKNPDALWRKAFDYAMMPMRISEQASRKAAILATLEMAQGAKKGYADTMSDIHEVVQGTLFSYDKTNKPVFLQGSTGRVLAMFQWYRIMSAFRMGLLFKRSIAAETPEIRTAAQKEFVGIMAMSGLLAGSLGLPMASLIFTALDAALGDDDEPVDTALDWRNWLREGATNLTGSTSFGERLGDIAAYGLTAALGMHLTKRIGMGDMFGMQSSPPPQMAGKDLAAWWAANQLGPAFSIGQSWVQAYDEIVNKGNVMRGLEVAMPKPLKDAMKAYRVWDEGEMTTISGKRTLGPDKITADMVPLLALGFNPLEAAKAGENSYSRTKLGAQLSSRRGRLIEDAAQALHGEGDIFEAKQALMDFNRKNPAFAIRGGEIRVAAVRSMKEGLGVPSKRERMLNSAYGIPPVE